MKFKVGDKVRVKSKEELKKLFEKNATIDGDGDWDWDYEYKLSDGTEEDIYFISNMKAACEEVATIVSVDKEFELYELEFEHKVFSDEDEYQFVEDWLEPYTDKPIYVSSFDGEEEETIPAEVYWEQVMPQIKEIVINAYNKGVEIGKAECL